MSNIVNILTFHHINSNKDSFKDSLTIPQSLFEKILKEVSKKFTFISYQNFIDFVFKKKKLPKKAILLTFDDGYLDNYIYAYPVLKRLNISAVIFVITGNIKISKHARDKMPYFKTHKELGANPDYNLFINTSEIQKMQDSGLIEIESHTQTHVTCKDKDYDKIFDELQSSFEFIKKETKKKSHYGFCWPRGTFDEVSMEAIKNSPYSFAFSTIDGAFCKNDNLFKIQRIDCSSWDGDEGKYIKRVKRKLAIYSNPFASKIYSDIREYRIKLSKK